MSLLLAFALMVPPSPGAVVVEPVANMYSAPSEDADVVSQAVFGVERRFAGREKVHGQRYARQTIIPAGCCSRRCVATVRTITRTLPPEPLPKWKTLSPNVYREPSATKHQPILTLPFAARLEVVAGPRTMAAGGCRSALRTGVPHGFSAAMSI